MRTSALENPALSETGIGASIDEKQDHEISVIVRFPSRLLTLYMRDLNEQLARRAENSFE